MARPRTNTLRTRSRSRPSRAADSARSVQQFVNSLPSEPAATTLRRDHIIAAKDAVSNVAFEDFRDDAQAWAARNLPALHLVSRSLIEKSVRHMDVARATAAFTGLLLGGMVVRSLCEEGLVAPETCQRNLIAHRVAQGNGLIYDGEDISQADFAQRLGAEATEGLAHIHNDAARTVCGAVILLCLTPGHAAAAGPSGQNP